MPQIAPLQQVLPVDRRALRVVADVDGGMIQAFSAEIHAETYSRRENTNASATARCGRKKHAQNPEAACHRLSTACLASTTSPHSSYRRQRLRRLKWDRRRLRLPERCLGR